VIIVVIVVVVKIGQDETYVMYNFNACVHSQVFAQCY